MSSFSFSGVSLFKAPARDAPVPGDTQQAPDTASPSKTTKWSAVGSKLKGDLESFGQANEATEVTKPTDTILTSKSPKVNLTTAPKQQITTPWVNLSRAKAYEKSPSDAKLDQTSSSAKALQSLSSASQKFLQSTSSSSQKLPQSSPSASSLSRSLTESAQSSQVPANVPANLPAEVAEDIEKISAWRNEMSSLEDIQADYQAGQMNLLHSQLHILTRELGDLQKQVMALTQKVDDDAEHAEEMNSSMEEGHQALSKLLEDGFSNLTQYVRTLDVDAATHKENVDALEVKFRDELKKVADEHTSTLASLNDDHHAKHARNADALESARGSILASLDGEVKAAVTLMLERNTELRTSLEAKLEETCEELRTDLQDQLSSGISSSEAVATLTENFDNVSTVLGDHEERVEGLETKVDKLCEDMLNDMEERFSKTESGEINLPELITLCSDMARQVKDGANETQELKQKLNDMSQNVTQVTDELRLAEDLLATHDTKIEEVERGCKPGAPRDVQELSNSFVEMAQHVTRLSTEMRETVEVKSANQFKHYEEIFTNRLRTLTEESRSTFLSSMNQELKSLLETVLSDVTGQVDNLGKAVKKEHELRVAAEARQDKLLSEQDEIILVLRKDIQVAVSESIELRLEFSELGRNNNQRKADLEDAHSALKSAWQQSQSEWQQSHSMLRNELAAHAKSTADKHDSIEDTLKSLNDQHHEKHALNAQQLEVGLQTVLGNTHAKMQEELQLLKSGGGGSLEELRQILTDVTQQVDILEQAVSKEHNLRMAVESKMDEVLIQQDRQIHGLSTMVQSAAEEANKALRLELAEYVRSGAEIKVAMEDAHVALRNELLATANSNVEWKRAMEDAHVALRGEVQQSHSALQQSHSILKDDIAARVESQRAHIAGEGLQDMLASTHEKLQEELQVLKAGAAENPGDMRKILTEVTQQVDNLDKGLEFLQSEMRLAVEAKSEETRAAVEEVHRALKEELAAHGRIHEKMKADVADAHGAIAEHGSRTTDQIKAELDNHSYLHDERISKLETQLHRELLPAMEGHKTSVLKLNEEHHTKHLVHSSNLKVMEQGVNDMIAKTHSALQEQLKDKHDFMEESFTNLTKQVDNLAVAFGEEQTMRGAMQHNMELMCKENADAMTQAHTTLHAEMTAQGNASFADLEKNLRNEQKRTASDVDACHRLLQAMGAKQAKKYAEFDQRIIALEGSALRNYEKEFHAMSVKIQEVNNNIQVQASRSHELCKSILSEQTQDLPTKLVEMQEAQANFQTQFFGELLKREKSLTAVEGRMSWLDNTITEVNDRHSADVQAIHTKVAEAVSKFAQQRTLSDNHKVLVDERLVTLERAVQESADTTNSALNTWRSDLSDQVSHLVHIERTARESLEKTLVSYINESRHQSFSMQAAVTATAEQLKETRRSALGTPASSLSNYRSTHPTPRNTISHSSAQPSPRQTERSLSPDSVRELLPGEMFFDHVQQEKDISNELQLVLDNYANSAMSSPAPSVPRGLKSPKIGQRDTAEVLASPEIIQRMVKGPKPGSAPNIRAPQGYSDDVAISMGSAVDPPMVRTPTVEGRNIKSPRLVSRGLSGKSTPSLVISGNVTPKSTQPTRKLRSAR